MSNRMHMSSSLPSLMFCTGTVLRPKQRLRVKIPPIPIRIPPAQLAVAPTPITLIPTVILVARTAVLPPLPRVALRLPVPNSSRHKTMRTTIVPHNAIVLLIKFSPECCKVMWCVSPVRVSPPPLILSGIYRWIWVRQHMEGQRQRV